MAAWHVSSHLELLLFSKKRNSSPSDHKQMHILSVGPWYYLSIIVLLFVLSHCFHVSCSVLETAFVEMAAFSKINK